MRGSSEVCQAAQALRLRGAGLKVFVAALADQNRGLFYLHYPMPVLLEGLGRSTTHAGRLWAELGLVFDFGSYFLGVFLHMRVKTSGPR